MNNIKYLNKAKIVEDNDRTVLVKKRKINIDKIYSYLQNRGFHNYVTPIEINHNEEIYPYIEELECLDDDRGKDIVYLTSILHSKTTKFELINIDKIKDRYEGTIQKLDEVFLYYSKLQDEIEEHIYMSPAELLLMKNISKVYLMLNGSRSFLEEYYKEAEKMYNERQVVLHGNLSLDHIIEADDKYLISWNKSRIDLPIYDLLIFYRNDFDKIEMESLYDIYQSKYRFTKEEKNLFFSLINIPEIVKLDSSHFINTIKVRKLVDYMDKTIAFTSKENNENQEANKQEFK